MTIIVELVEGFDQNHLKVSIKDTGVGIREEDQRKLFKLFGFLENTRQLNSNGIGLGLVISHQIVRQFGGSFEVQSKVNEGSTFTFTFVLEQNPEGSSSVSLGDIDFSKMEPNQRELVFLWKDPSIFS